MAWTPDEIPDQSGRIALITGANSGIGEQTARVLAAHGAHVILAGRSQDKLRATADAIRAHTPEAQLTTLGLDLGDLASIHDAAATVVGRDEPLDLLFNNAGVMDVPERRTTRDGFELTVGTNHLGHYALTAQLLPALLRSPAARIVTVSAIAAKWPNGKLTDLMSDTSYKPMTAYAKSKRANVVFTQELARRLDGTHVLPVVVHPGSAMTALQRHGEGRGLRALLTPVAARLLMGSPEGAAWPSLYAATADGITPGAFIAPAGRDQTSGTPKPTGLPRGAGDPELGAWLLAESERLTGVPFPATRPTSVGAVGD